MWFCGNNLKFVSWVKAIQNISILLGNVENLINVVAK
jgi:hypothetical protein